MKKSTMILIVLVAIILLVGGSFISSYNKLIDLNEQVDNQSSNIDTQLERRLNLIPNLVNTVKGYTNHETETIELITKARENLLKANGIEEKAKGNEELSEAIDALMVIVENYPDLKADTQFTNLQDELSGTENRIAIARKEYNEAVKSYNKAIKQIPNNIIASIFNFEEKNYFESKEEAKTTPEVNFD
ncbi:MAG TPA: LemA family protein [Firmicutes bacterium]|nr:LemA family protein [Bacillota bacterium]